MILGDLVGGTTQKKMDALRGTFHHVVSSLEVLLSSPHHLELMDFRAHEASGGGYLLEGAREDMRLPLPLVSASLLPGWTSGTTI